MFTHDRRRLDLLLLGFFLLLTLGACDPNTPTPIADCTPGSFGTPILDSPADFEIVASFTPTFSWTDPGGVNCNPTGYDVVLGMNPSFTGPTINGRSSFPTASWTPTNSLSKATEYWWKVAAITEQTGRVLYGEYSQPRRFFTGPVCDPKGLSPAMMQSPKEGATISEEPPTFEWGNGNRDCIPEGYHIEFGELPEIPEAGPRVETGSPRTSLMPEIQWMDCTRYYWRVVPVVEGVAGPVPETWSFFTDFASSCVPEASISGIVWHDLCAVPDGPVDPSDIPPGCLLFGDALGANGTLDTGEPGIGGITLHLGNGACPSTGLSTTSTAPDGSYAFTGLAAGTYCISVDALNDGNDLVLIPGGWTYPARGDNPQYTTQALSPGENVTGVNFGWDYQFLPAPPPSEAAESACFFEAAKNSNCRMSDYQESKLIHILLQGDMVELVGLNPELTHGRFLMEDERQCWVWLGLMEGPENPVETCDVPVTDPPPKPEPPTLECKPDLSQDECEQSGGTWYEAMSAEPVCRCPE